jgi:holin-like protein
MKYVKQFAMILLVSFAGELLNYLLPLPVPASIYGLVLMLALLMTGALKLDAVEDAGKFMIEIMPVMFIPAGVGLMESWGELKAVLVPVLVITLVSTIVVMVVSGRVTQAVIRLEKKHKGGDAK